MKMDYWRLSFAIVEAIKLVMNALSGNSIKGQAHAARLVNRFADLEAKQRAKVDSR